MAVLDEYRRPYVKVFLNTNYGLAVGLTGIYFGAIPVVRQAVLCP